MEKGSTAGENTPTEASLPVGFSSKEDTMTRREQWMVCFGCALLGFMTLLPFQLVVVMLPVLCDHFLDGNQLGNSMLGLYQAVCVLALFAILKVGSLSKWLVQGGLATTFACMTAFGPAFFFGTQTSRIACIHIILGLLGSCNAMLQAASFARAAILPRNCVGITSIGQATAGLVAFILTSILMNCVYDMGVKEDVIVLTSICCGFCAMITLFSILYMHKFLNARVCVQSVRDAIVSSSKNAGDAPAEGDVEDVGKREAKFVEDETLLPPRPWLTMIRGSFWELASVFLVFFVTFNLFPRVGPVSFNFDGKGPARMVWLFGMQFIGDFLGRSCLKLTNVHPKFGFLFLSRNATVAASFLRFIFYIPFFLAMKMEDTPFVNSLAWLLIVQLLLAFTLGWVATLSLIHCSLSVVRASEKARMGSLSTIMLATAIGVGLYSALAY